MTLGDITLQWPFGSAASFHLDEKTATIPLY